MGDRALVIFTAGTDVSPVIYLHWSGEQLPELLAQHKDLMATRRGDVCYAAARFVGIVHATMPDDNLSLGIWNAEPNTRDAVLYRDTAELEAISHGDAGLVLVDVNDYCWQAYGGYLADD